MSNMIRESFDIILTSLWFFGLYPSQSTSIWKKIWTYSLYVSKVLLILLLFVNIVFKGYSDVMLMNQMVMFLAEGAASCLKILPFVRNAQKIRKCIDYFGSKTFVPKDNEERKIVDECVWVCRRNVRICCIVVALGETWWNVFPLFQKNYVLPADIWLPYEITQNWVYYVTYFYVVAVCIYMGLVGEMMEPLIAGLAYHATCQLKILKYKLRNITAFLKDDSCSAEMDAIYVALKKCIIHHNMILDFVTEFENCFSFCVVSQIGGCMFALCYCCIAMIMVSATSVYYILFINCYVFLIFQMFFYCHYGTLLFEENEGLITDIYMSRWYKCDVRVRRMLIVIMERSKRPLILTAGKVIDLTYSTFTSVIKSSYSLIAVMNNS